MGACNKKLKAYNIVNGGNNPPKIHFHLTFLIFSFSLNHLPITFTHISFIPSLYPSKCVEYHHWVSKKNKKLRKKNVPWTPPLSPPTHSTPTLSLIQNIEKSNKLLK